MKRKFKLAIGFMLLNLTVNAQIAIFDTQGIEKDFKYNLGVYADAFIGPVVDAYSSSQIASNHITAEVLQPFAVSFGIQASGTAIKSKDLSFNFNESPFSKNFVLTNPDKPIIPSILGGRTTAEFIYRIEGQSIANPGTTLTYEERISALDGITSPGNAIPAGAIHLAVGLPLNTEVYLRALPTIDLDGVKNYMVGGGLKHQISQYFLEKEKPLHISVAGFYSKSDFTFDPESTFEGERQEVNFTDKTLSLESIISYDKKYYSFFGQLGYYTGESEFSVDGNYRYTAERRDLPPPAPPTVQHVFEVVNPVSIKRSNSGVQGALGVSLKFKTHASLSVAYHLAKNNSLALNLRFGINNGPRD